MPKEWCLEARKGECFQELNSAPESSAGFHKVGGSLVILGMVSVEL